MLSARLRELVDAGVIERSTLASPKSSVYADRRTLAGWWRGDLTLRQAMQVGLVLEGRREWIRAFPGWFERYRFAAVAPAVTAS
jgi:hypothetical protein